MGKAELQEILLPGTDPQVAGRYSTLAERARDAVFGLDEEEVVVLDTETTGLNPGGGDELIQIAAAIMKGPKVLDRWSTFVDPGRNIPPEITELTGITPDMVQGAPGPREAVRELAAFSGDRDLIAHNAPFDKGFVMRHALSGELTGEWLDSLELSRIALPRFSSHKLKSLSEAFDTSSPSHRATDDVDALCGVWRVLLVALSDFPEGLVGFIAGLRPGVTWPLRKVLSHIASASPDARFSLHACRRAMISSAAPADKDDAAETIGPGSPFPSEREVAEAFEPGGIVDGIYPGFEARTGQVEMATEVIRTFSSFGYAAIEAGTGIGKSMAYLLPAALTAKRLNIGVGVATKTNSLMDQLVYHELPKLSAALDGGLTFVALKGYEHYPCLRKLERFAREEQSPDADPEIQVAELVMLATVYAFIGQTTWGDLDLVHLYWKNLPRGRITATSNDCMKRECPYYAECLLHGLRRAAAGADIVVTNHALLFRDIMTDGGILPPIKFWVVDEAHSAEAEARKQLSPTVRGQELISAIESIGVSAGCQLKSVEREARAREKLKVEGAEVLLAMAEQGMEQARVTGNIATSFFSYVKELGGSTSRSGYDHADIWLGEEVRSSGTWGTVSSLAGTLCDRLGELAATVRDIEELLGPGSGHLADIRAGLEASASTLVEARDSIALIVDGEDGDFAYSASVSRNPDKMAEELSALMLDVGAKLADDFYPRVMSVVYTSATIATGKSFQHFEHAVGLDRLEEGAHGSLQLPSGYDFDRNMTVFIPTDLPLPNSPGYLDALENTLFGVHCAMGGSTLTLFTNRREMEQEFERLEPRLEDEGIRLLCQLRGISYKHLRDEFLADEATCLFALRSFWEGFDAPGETLKCVIIPKLPFSRPDDPLERERKQRDNNAWRNYSLPEAIISLKQAAGRLIRTSTDRGFLVLCDRRLIERGYGKAFRESLPSANQRLLDTDSMCREIRESLS